MDRKAVKEFFVVEIDRIDAVYILYDLQDEIGRFLSDDAFKTLFFIF